MRALAHERRRRATERGEGSHQLPFPAEGLLQADDVDVAQHAEDLDLAERRLAHLRRGDPTRSIDKPRGVASTNRRRDGERTISSSSDSLNFLMATTSAFSLFRHFSTTPYAPSPTTPSTSYLFMRRGALNADGFSRRLTKAGSGKRGRARGLSALEAAGSLDGATASVPCEELLIPNLL